MQIDLNGKIAVVTGAGRGIGREIAMTFAREGVLTIGIDKEEDGLHTLKQEFAAQGLKGDTLVCDVRDVNAVEAVVGKITMQHERIDILVNNAGVSIKGQVDGQDPADWSHNVDANLTGTFLMCRTVIPVMKRQKFGAHFERRILSPPSFPRSAARRTRPRKRALSLLPVCWRAKWGRGTLPSTATRPA